MWSTASFGPLVLLGSIFGYNNFVKAVTNLRVDTTVGPVNGILNATTPDVAIFLGIPYAEPPVGDLRWEPLKAKVKSTKVIQATEFGPSCPQYSYSNHFQLFDYSVNNTYSEDCLSINVWAPYSAAPSYQQEKLPVIIWAYGGGFRTGGGAVPIQDPAQWIQRSQKHIVVSYNYRTNIFGFPNAPGLAKTQQNLGLLDQRVAIEWVRDNIEAFGGDCSRITLWGQSAGASSMDYYTYAYLDDPIASAVILDSGSVYSTAGATVGDYSNFTFVGEKLGCTQSSPEKLLACMRKVEFSKFEKFLEEYDKAGTKPTLGFLPIVDNLTKFGNYSHRTEIGKFSKMPAIMGSNADEGNLLAPLTPKGVVNKTLSPYYTLDGILCPSLASNENRYSAGVPTFRYLYDGNFSDISPAPWQGAFHGSELPLIFGTYGVNDTLPPTAFEIAVSHRLQDLWLAFATDRVAGLQNMSWPEFKPNGMALHFANDSIVEQEIPIKTLTSVCNGVMGVLGASPPQ